MQGAPLRLRCEYLEDPLGIDAQSPRLSWWPNDSRPAEIQTSYEILAASSRDLLRLDEGDLWDSGRVESDETSVVYRGKALVSGRRVWWKVRSFDSDGLASPWSEPAFFEAGLLQPADWRGQWISSPLTGSRISSVPVPVLRRSFELAAAPRSARLYVAALGLYHLEINGQAVAGDALAPGWGDFDQQAEYQTFDVTAALNAGDNVIAALLGDGAYCGRTGLGGREHYGNRPALKAQLHLQLVSGASLVIASDERWQWQPSWILSSDAIAGESVDWRQFDADWSRPSSCWSGYPVQIRELSVPMRASRQRSVCRLGEMTARLLDRNAQRLLFELPELLVGRARVTSALPAGAIVRLRYAMHLDDRGELGEVSGEDLHIAAGLEPAERMVSRFTSHAFRYVEVSGDLRHGLDLTLAAEKFGQPVVKTARFHSDHAGLNELFERQSAHLSACLQSVPFAGLSETQRQGWLAANAPRIKSWLLSHAAEPELADWLNRIAAAQLQDGSFPALVPMPPDAETALLGADEILLPASREHLLGASETLIEGAWQQFRLLGDRRALEAAYPIICRYLNGLAERHPDHIRGQPPDDFAATLAYYRSVRTASRMAGVLGRLTDLEDFEYQAAAIRQAFRNRFVSPDGRLVSDRLSAHVAVLNQNLLDPEERKMTLAEMYRLLDVHTATHPHDTLQPVSADDQLVPELLRTLTLLGRVESALERVLALAQAPDVADPQLTGRSQAGVIDWLLTSLAGMDQGRDLSDSANAYRRMRIQPRPLLGGVREGGALLSAGPPIRSIEAQLDTVNGRYQVSWRITDTAFELNVTVPCNCSADVILPDDTVHPVVAGEHQFTMPFQHAGDGIPILREVSGG